jgi:hypothetical protein
MSTQRVSNNRLPTWWCKNRHYIMTCISDKWEPPQNWIVLNAFLFYLIASKAYSCQCHHGQISCSNHIAENNKQNPQLYPVKMFCWLTPQKKIKKGHSPDNLTWRTVAPFLPQLRNHWSTPLSYASFQIAPWPPGLPTGKSDLLINHLPSSAFTTGTKGYRYHWRNLVRAS